MDIITEAGTTFEDLLLEEVAEFGYTGKDYYSSTSQLTNLYVLYINTNMKCCINQLSGHIMNK